MTAYSIALTFTGAEYKAVEMMTPMVGQMNSNVIFFQFVIWNADNMVNGIRIPTEEFSCRDFIRTSQEKLTLTPIQLNYVLIQR